MRAQRVEHRRPEEHTDDCEKPGCLGDASHTVEWIPHDEPAVTAPTDHRQATEQRGEHLEAVAPVEYNYRTKAEHEKAGTALYVEGDQPVEDPGRSCFLRVDDRVFHSYSVYARGLETIGGSYYMLDETALGRQEDWEEPKGRADSARGAIPDFAN